MCFSMIMTLIILLRNECTELFVHSNDISRTTIEIVMQNYLFSVMQRIEFHLEMYCSIF